MIFSGVISMMRVASDRYEIPVMADKDQRARVIFEREIQGLDRFHVEVIRRLVHHDHIRFLQSQLAEHQATLFATRYDLH